MEHIAGVIYIDRAPTNGSSCQCCDRVINKGEQRLKISQSKRAPKMSKHVCSNCVSMIAGKFKVSFEF